MVKSIFVSFALVLISFGLVSCQNVNQGQTSNRVAPIASMVSATITQNSIIEVTVTPNPTITLMVIPNSTLEPRLAEYLIEGLLQEPIDCSAPCFWGAIPGKTKLSNVSEIFKNFGVDILSTIDNADIDPEVTITLNNGISMFIIFSVQDEVVQSGQIYITPEKKQNGVTRKWLAYSPETLIEQYGLPSRVNFSVGSVAPSPAYSMDLYFDSVDLIASYFGYDYQAGPPGMIKVCPLIDQQDDVRIWFGENPRYPPGSGVPLEKASSLSLESFYNLMLGPKEQACIFLRNDAFP